MPCRTTIPFHRPWKGARDSELIARCLESGSFSGDGPFTLQARALLERLTGAPAVLLTTSCTAALELAALLLDICPGDEVILPSFTFVSSANPFCLRGAHPRFVDIDPRTLNMDPSGIPELLTERTRAVVPVHYAGVACDLDPILKLSQRWGFHVVEDAAQAIGSTRKGRPLGTEGVLGAVSFHGTKNIGCGEGGALLVNDAELVEAALVLREKGTNRSQFLRGMVDKYTWVDVGSSFLPSDLLAALLVSQLEDLELVTRKRRRLWMLYHEELLPLARQGVLTLPDPADFAEANGHIFWMLCGDALERTRLIDFLRSFGIQAAFHYVPLHLSPIGRHFGGCEGQLPVTEDLAERLLRLPLWAGMEEDLVHRVGERLREFYGA